MAYRLKYKETTAFQKNVLFQCPKCGITVEFGYSAPYRCPNKECDAKLPLIEKLIGKSNQNNRVKYFAEGKI